MVWPETVSQNKRGPERSSWIEEVSFRRVEGASAVMGGCSSINTLYFCRLSRRDGAGETCNDHAMGGVQTKKQQQ